MLNYRVVLKITRGTLSLTSFDIETQMSLHRPCQRGNACCFSRIQNCAELLFGRVIKLAPGGDGIVRVVTLKTAKGELKRPVNKLSMFVLNFDFYVYLYVRHLNYIHYTFALNCFFSHI